MRFRSTSRISPLLCGERERASLQMVCSSGTCLVVSGVEPWIQFRQCLQRLMGKGVTVFWGFLKPKCVRVRVGARVRILSSYEPKPEPEPDYGSSSLIEAGRSKANFLSARCFKIRTLPSLRRRERATSTFGSSLMKESSSTSR